MAYQDDKMHELSTRIRAGEHSREVLHDLWPPVVYISVADGERREDWAEHKQCSITDDINRRCIREAHHKYECLIPLTQLSWTIADR